MSPRAPLSVLASVALAACAGGASGPPSLSYDLPRETAVRYVTGDTSTMDIDAGGQSMQAFVSSAATLGASFARAAGGVEVTITVEDLDARVANPMASASADETGIDGALVFTLDRRGEATLVSAPTTDEVAGQFFQPLSLAHGFFPRLPGRAVGPGESWVDTIRVEGEQGGGSVSSVTLMTYVVSGDTVVAGRSLVRIGMEGSSEVAARGVTTGMDVTQNLQGTVTGWILWDLQRGLMVESYSESDARGTMEVSAAPFPLGMRVRSQSRVRLQEGT